MFVYITNHCSTSKMFGEKILHIYINKIYSHSLDIVIYLYYIQIYIDVEREILKNSNDYLNKSTGVYIQTEITFRKKSILVFFCKEIKNEGRKEGRKRGTEKSSCMYKIGIRHHFRIVLSEESKMQDTCNFKFSCIYIKKVKSNIKKLIFKPVSYMLLFHIKCKIGILIMSFDSNISKILQQHVINVKLFVRYFTLFSQYKIFQYHDLGVPGWLNQWSM